MTVTSGAQGTGNGSVLFTVAANTGAARTTTVTIAGQIFTVNEAAPAAPPPACAFAVSPQTGSIAAGGGQLVITVSTTAGCAWSATSNVNFMTIRSGATGTGPGTVTVSIARNNGAARTGTLTVAGQTVTVTQAAGNTGGDDNVS